MRRINLIYGEVSRYLKSPAFKLAFMVYLITRIVLSLWMFGVSQIYNRSLYPDPVLHPYVGVIQERNVLLEVWQRWDTLHYQAIAERGYDAFGSALFVPPLYPILIRGVSNILGSGSLLAGVIISNIAYILALSALYNLTIYELGDHKNAKRTLIYLAFFPTAFFFSCCIYRIDFFISCYYGIVCNSKRKMVSGWSLG